ncbi:unnamed protein product [Phytomonas sp. Hart1]|nr:unnamed protein product [Phytomonas sp. Hart1]|eukprot:CCW71897.1 unnamed protein product [Phytomonas sp. isolate Hart1]
MPTLSVAKDFLFSLIGKTYTDEQFEDICFQFGVELDDITTEKEMHLREHCKLPSAAGGEIELSEDIIYKIDTPANRYDLLSAEGMSTALRVFLGFMPTPRYQVLNCRNPLYHMTVEKSIKHVRDYVVCAVLKNIHFNEQSYAGFIDFQEKLHQGLARRRTLASVGTHDLDKIPTNRFLYSARTRKDIRFIPLRQTKELDCTGDGLINYYAEDRHIRKYVPLISEMPKYPVIMDGEGKRVLSLPPVINSDFSHMTANTKNVFIECTAPDHYKAQVLVNQLVCAFSIYCEKSFTIEAVAVDYEDEAPDGTKREICPVLETTKLTVDIDKLNKIIGINMKSSDECAVHLRKMMYDVKKKDEKTLEVETSPVRTDVLGVSDVLEDVAIAYGYDNITYQECYTNGDVSQTAVSKFGHLLRVEMANAGYLELLTFSLCSRDESFAYLNRQDDEIAVQIANPQTVEFQVCRPSLLPGLLKTMGSNKSQPLPQRYFECADVVLLDNAKNFPPVLETGDNYPSPGARNQRHLAAIHCASSGSSFENIHSLTEHVFVKLGIPKKGNEVEGWEGDVYSLEKGEDGAFFPGRCMDIFLHRRGEKVKIGGLGVIHPNTLKAYDIIVPCSYVEINIQFLCTNL